MEIQQLTFNGTCLAIGHSVSTKITPVFLQPRIFQIEEFSIIENSGYFIGRRLFLRKDFMEYNCHCTPNIHSSIQQISSDKECFLSTLLELVPLVDIDKIIQLVSLSAFHQQPSSDLYVWTHYIDNDHQLHHQLQSLTNTGAPNPLSKLLIPRNIITTALSDWKRIMTLYIQTELNVTTDRTRKITRPFPLNAYLAIFSDFGDYFPPSKVDTEMIFTTYVYENEITKLDDKMPKDWRKKVCDFDYLCFYFKKIN